uniref:CCR4-NOT transcription complex subunit1 NOT1 n=1 Tax=Metchnikovella dogieli TaxID=2804710 RepID=A0A896WNU2_9MICR|nr:CCR4-NOT transcription complex subunit1 NOT1 [Metchnikovella dogieli]
MSKIHRQLSDAGAFSAEPELAFLVDHALEFAFESLQKQLNCPKKTSLRSLNAMAFLFATAAANIDGRPNAVSAQFVVLTFLSKIACGILGELEKENSYANIYGLVFGWFVSFFSETASTPTLDACFESIYTVLAELEPAAVPQFSFVWFDIALSPAVLQHPIRSSCEKTQKHAVRILCMAIEFATKNTLTDHALHLTLIRVLICILRDHPDFFVKHCTELTACMPLEALQIRNIVLSAFPSTYTICGPFEPGLSLETINSSSIHPPIPEDVAKHAKTAQESILAALERLDEVNGPAEHNTVVNQAVVVATTTPSKAGKVHDILFSLLRQAQPRQFYRLISALINNVRYPNTHTLFCTNILFEMFLLDFGDLKKEVAMRAILERLIANRPHPWGVLFLFIELVRSEKYSIADAPFITQKKKVHALFSSIKQTCL